MKSLRLIVIALLLPFLFIPGKAMGAVLCIRADGHMAMEAFHDGHCGTLEHSGFLSHDHLDPCVDVVLFSGDLENKTLSSPRGTLLKLEAKPLALLLLILFPYTGPPNIPVFYRPKTLHSTIPLLRTVVLLL